MVTCHRPFSDPFKCMAECHNLVGQIYCLLYIFIGESVTICNDVLLINGRPTSNTHFELRHTLVLNNFTWLNFLNSTIRLKIKLSTCLADCDSLSSFCITHKMLPHSLT